MTHFLDPGLDQILNYAKYGPVTQIFLGGYGRV